MEQLKRFHPETGQSVDVEVFDVLVGPFGSESRLVRLRMDDGRRFHCHFWHPVAEVSFPGWPKERLPRWVYPGDGRVKDLSLDVVVAAVDEVLQKNDFHKAFALTCSPQETWQSIVEFYEEYPDYPWWDPVRRFLPLVRRIAASPLAAKLYASQSHETLLVSTEGTAPERETVPFLAIAPRKDSIHITKYQRLTEDLGGGSYPLAEAWLNLKPFFDWLVAHSGGPGCR